MLDNSLLFLFLYTCLTWVSLSSTTTVLARTHLCHVPELSQWYPWGDSNFSDLIPRGPVSYSLALTPNTKRSLKSAVFPSPRRLFYFSPAVDFCQQALNQSPHFSAFSVLLLCLPWLT